ncbi:MAG: hypothetical protein LBJ31_04615 [Treponema sp.]|jgi:hypothetical protein|nr:hypothetical protein [Treponema sp.]
MTKITFGGIYKVKMIFILAMIVLPLCGAYAQSFVYEKLSFETVDKAYVEGFGILEYGLAKTPFTGEDKRDMELYMWLFFGTVEEQYVLDIDSVLLVEDNKALSTNVKRLMSKHGCNLSSTYIPNSDGSTTFIVNFRTASGNYELWTFKAYKR